MPIGQNIYFQDPYMGQITSNLGKALFGDPSARMKADYYASEVDKNRADAGKLDAEGKLAGGRYSAQQKLTPDLMATLAPQPGESPAAHMIRIAPVMSAIAQYGTGAKDASEGIGNLSSNAYATGDDNDKRTSLVMQGKAPTDDFAGTTTQADRVLDNKGGWKYRQGIGEANIKAGADKAVAGINQGAESARFFGKPIELNPGQEAVIPKSNPNNQTLGDRVFGAPSKITDEGAAGVRIAQGQERPADRFLYSGSEKAASPGGAGGKPPMINGKSMDDVVRIALGNMNGALVSDPHNPKAMVMDPNFKSTLDPVKLQHAYDAAGAELQNSKDVNRAGAAFRAALGLEDGASYKAPGFWDNYLPSWAGGGGKGQVVQPQPGNAPALPASPLPAAAAPSAPAALPPIQARQAGVTTISVPGKGDFVWSGTGWAPKPQGPVY